MGDVQEIQGDRIEGLRPSCFRRKKLQDASLDGSLKFIFRQCIEHGDVICTCNLFKGKASHSFICGAQA